MVNQSALEKDEDSLKSLPLRAGTRPLLQSVHLHVDHTIMVGGTITTGIVITDFQAIEAIQIVHHTGAIGALLEGDPLETGVVEVSRAVLLITAALVGIVAGAGVQSVVPVQGIGARH